VSYSILLIATAVGAIACHATPVPTDEETFFPHVWDRGSPFLFALAYYARAHLAFEREWDT